MSGLIKRVEIGENRRANFPGLEKNNVHKQGVASMKMVSVNWGFDLNKVL